VSTLAVCAAAIAVAESERRGRRRSAGGAPQRDGFTVTVNEELAVLALESVASHVTRVRPILWRLPDRGWHVTGRVPSLSSVAVTR
jgi:hypothetical protein